MYTDLHAFEKKRSKKNYYLTMEIYIFHIYIVGRYQNKSPPESFIKTKELDE